MIELVLAVVICAVAGVVTGVTGFGFGLAAIPFLSAIYDPRLAVVIGILAGLPGTGWVAWRSHAPVATRPAVLMTVVAAVFTPVGLWAAWQLSTGALSVSIGVLVICSVAAFLLGVRVARRDRTDVVAGALSGFLAAGTGMGGPPVVLALHGSGIDPGSARRTSAFILGVQSVLAFSVIVFAGGVAPADLLIVAAAVPAAFLGTLAGSALFARMHSRHARGAAIGLLFLSGLFGIGNGLGLY